MAVRDLTEREQQIAQLVALGKPNKEIAALMDISENTIRAHVRNVMTKLGMENRVQVAVWVVEQRQHAADRVALIQELAAEYAAKGTA